MTDKNIYSKCLWITLVGATTVLLIGSFVVSSNYFNLLYLLGLYIIILLNYL